MKKQTINVVLADVISNFPVSIYWKDVEGKYLGCNICQAELLNLSSPEEIKGKTDFDLYPAVDANILRETDSRVIKSQKAQTLQEEGTLPILGRTKFLTKKIPLLNSEKIVIGILGVSIQIETELNNVGEKDIEFARSLAKKTMGIAKEGQTIKDYIEDIHDYFENIIALLPGHVYWQDKNGIFLGCNNLQAKHAGLGSRNEIIGKSNRDMIWKEAADELDKINKKVLDTGLPYIAEEIATMTNGTKTYLSNKTPLKDRSGNIIGMLGVSLDISELKQTQKNLEATKASEARFKTLSAVGGMIAHELRTPLSAMSNTIKGVEQFMLKLIEGYEAAVANGLVENPIRPHLMDFVKESVGEINQSLGYAQATVNSILAGLHHSTGEQSGIDALTSLSLEDTVNKALQQYPLRPDQRELITVSDVANLIVKGEEEIILHVLHNLLKNALHIIASAGKGDIKIYGIDEGDKVRLVFSDTAKGIAPEHLPHIFEPFYTTKKETAKSIGLGLYFCKMALKKMGAKIKCESIFGEYTQFTITLLKEPMQQ